MRARVKERALVSVFQSFKTDPCKEPSLFLNQLTTDDVYIRIHGKVKNNGWSRCIALHAMKASCDKYFFGHSQMKGLIKSVPCVA